MASTDDTPRVRQRTVRVTLDATLIRPWRRGDRWTAEAGHFRAEGTSEKATADTLAAGVASFLAEYRPPTVLRFRGHVAVVSLDLSIDPARPVWHQEVIRPSGSGFSSIGSASSWDEAEADARHTLAQATTDWHDDASVHAAAEYVAGAERFRYGQYGPAELYRYAAWQRAAKAAMDDGRPDWHEWASSNADRFAVPRACTS
jgi:hypothetical protein